MEDAPGTNGRPDPPMSGRDVPGRLDRAEMLRLLRRSPIARIAFALDDQPYALPVNCACDDDGRVVFRTGDHSVLSGLSGSRVAVEVDGYDVTSRAGWCVLVTGVAREINDTMDRPTRDLMRLDVVPWAPGERDRWFVVEPQTISGRRVADPNGAVEGWFAGVPHS
jgi:nitroimidazol reductase NimA-like FMN-containing flavoprotein (pyridoxamine 5'-phosphate oxidase superfamily)